MAEHSVTETGETFEEQLARVRQMADPLVNGAGTWDLSDLDRAALQAMLEQRAALLAALEEALPLAMHGLHWYQAKFAANPHPENDGHEAGVIATIESIAATIAKAEGGR